MRKLRIIEHISLDGVIQGPGGPKEDSSGGFAYGGWAAPHDDPQGGAAIVATHRPDSLAWGPAESLGPNIVEGVRRIKAMDGPHLIVWGSSTVTPALLEHELADEILLLVFPVLLGTGKRFFSDGTTPRELALVGTKAVSSGVIISTYKPSGPLRTGSYDGKA